MSQQTKTQLENLEQPVSELTREQADATRGGIIIIGGKYALSATPGFGATTELNPQPLPPKVANPLNF